MNCSRRIYKGNTYEICLPLPFDPDEVTSMTISFFTIGDFMVVKGLDDMEIDTTGGTMCVTLSQEDIELFPDGVLHYTISYTEDGITYTDEHSTGDVIKTPTNYDSHTLEEYMEGAYDSGYTEGYIDAMRRCNINPMGFVNDSDIPLTFTFNKHGNPQLVSLKYSYDGIHYEDVEIDSDFVSREFEIPAGGSIHFDGSENNGHWSDSSGYWYFSAATQDATIKLVGSLASLYGSDELQGASCFRYLFKNFNIVDDASEFILPYETLTESCYGNMFYYCSSLTSAPELPATTLASECYQDMFARCTSLTSAPELPATTLAYSCYQYMFRGCASLVNAPALPATTLADDCYFWMFDGCSFTTAPILPATTLTPYCYSHMFANCSNLVTAPELPATTLANSCYSGMFNNCTSLTVAPELPATTLTPYCYDGMFEGCSNLVAAPELPATILSHRCYNLMFYRCSSLTSAPELPATALATGCYQQMFAGCTSLTSAPVLPANYIVNGSYKGMFSGCTSLNEIIVGLVPPYPGQSYELENWVWGVAPSGNFTCIYPSAISSFPIGPSGIPEGWIVNGAYDSGLTPDFSNLNRSRYFTLEPIDDDVVFNFTWDYNEQLFFMYRIDDGDWIEASFAHNITVPAGSKLEMKANNYKYEGSRIWADNPFKVSGNIFSLVYGDDFYYSSGFDVKGFQNFFAGAPVVDASGLYLGDKHFSVPEWGYSLFFANCTGLTSPPELPMNNIGQYGYYEMFYGCTSLEKAPVLPSEYGVNEHSYEEMFWGCSSLQYINCNLRNYDSNITYNWVGGNNLPGSGMFIANPNSRWNYSISGIPTGWAVYNYELEASTNYISTDLDGGEISFTISSNSSWSAKYDDWFTPSRVSGQEGEGITLRVNIPAGDTTRIGVLRITNDFGGKIEIPVARSDQRFVFFDDFPGGTSEEWGYTQPYDPDFVSEFYGYDNINEYLSNYFERIDNESLDNGVNMYALIGSMQFNDKTYWVYRQMCCTWGWFDDESTSNENMTYALLDVTRTDIQSKSLRANYNNIYQHYNCFDHFLSQDGTEYEDIPEREGDDTYVIVDVQ